MQNKIFFLSGLAFLIGVWVRSFFDFSIVFVFLSGLIGLTVGLFLFFSAKFKIKNGALLCIFLVCFSVGTLRMNFADKAPDDFFETRLGSRENFSGLVTSEPEASEKSIRFIADVDNFFAKDAKTKILIFDSADSKINYGDKIEFFGRLEKAKNFLTDSGREFDYVSYLRSSGVFYIVRYPEISVVSQGEGSSIKEKLFSFKKSFSENLFYSVSSPESVFLGGLLLGEKSAFDPEMEKAFIRTGTIHMVALSGYNVTLVADWIMKALLFLSFPIRVGAGVFAIFLFVIMTGGSATAIRAGVMASLSLIAKVFGRIYDAGKALFLAVLIMVFWNPFLLAFDVSFQLSVLATFAIIFLPERAEKYFLWVPKRFGLRDIASSSFAVYLFVLPFLLYKMGSFSISALPANFSVLPFIPVTMIAGFMTGFSGFISETLSLFLGAITSSLLRYELAIINFLSNIPFSFFSIPKFPAFLVFLAYLLIIYKLFGRSIKRFFGSDK